MTRILSLTVLPEALAVCRFDAGDRVPAWAMGAAKPFLSVTRTTDELSIVCRQSAVPAGVQCETGWRAMKVCGPLEFCEIGILASLTASLAGAGVSVFVVSTFDTDYLLVKQDNLETAQEALIRDGHQFA